jgi:hypothetical protein
MEFIIKEGFQIISLMGKDTGCFLMVILVGELLYRRRESLRQLTGKMRKLLLLH